MTCHQIKTPETHPDHHTVGRYFCGPGGTEFYCDSYDPRIGYWMTSRDCVGRDVETLTNEQRRNVSERAIGHTFHEVPQDPTAFSLWRPRKVT